MTRPFQLATLALGFAASALCQIQTWTISTAAGGVDPVFFNGTGDGGPAAVAGLGRFCYDVAVDGQGNVYIVAGRLIRKVTPTGTISTVAGGGASIQDLVRATDAELAPIAIAADAAGNLYIADTVFNDPRIRKVSTNGMITTVAGGVACCALGDGGSAMNAYIGNPLGLAVDSAGNIYIAQADGQNNLIRKVTAATGAISTVAGGGSGFSDGSQATAVALSKPSGVAVDSAGNLFIVESNGNRVRKVSTSGIISTVAGTGAASNTGDNGPALKAGLNAPWHVAVDTTGGLYITQINDGTIRFVSPAGTISTVAGSGVHGSTGDNGPATSGTLDRPAGIAYQPLTGKLYVADATGAIARVRLLTPALPPPTVNPGGVVPVYSSNNTVQAGSWISIYGANFGLGTSLWNGDFPLSLGGTSVTVNSTPAYLWFVGPTQINLQVPDDSTLGPVDVVVTTLGGAFTSKVSLGAYGPSLSLFDNKYAAAIAITAGSTGNSGAGYDYIGPPGRFSFPTRPARPGETLILFGVGFGPTSPTVPAGSLYSGAAPAIHTPQFTIGGFSVPVAFAGIVQAGLFQFNVTAPGAGSGDQILQGIVGGAASPAGVYITMQ